MKQAFTISIFFRRLTHFCLFPVVLWGMLHSAAVNFFPSTVPSAHAAAMTPDTTVVDCAAADTALGTWFNTLQLEIVLPANQRGDSVAVAPIPPSNYAFNGPCGDTFRVEFKIYDLARVLVETKRYVFIAVDNKAPVISSSVADSLVLACTDSLPSRNAVTATDNCQLDTLLLSQTEEGGGNCIYRRKIIRQWTARDACGNTSTLRQVYIYSDDDGPVFQNFPRDTVVTCRTNTSVDSMGRPAAIDNCDPTPTVSFSDQITRSNLPGCTSNYDVRRLWQATDLCGNTTFRTQVIRVRDLENPRFTLPRDTVIDCRFGDDPSVTGVPSDLQDNCDTLTSSNVRFTDVLIANRCVNDYTVERTWIVTDNCGNEVTGKQRIQVIDTLAPRFITPAQDLILACTSGQNVPTLFQQWLDQRGGASVADNCSTLPNQITWTLVDASTGGAVTAPFLRCPTPDGILYEREVLFIAADECDNRDTSRAVFRITDRDRPTLSGCWRDTTLATDPGQCTAAVRPALPRLADACSAGLNFFYSLNGGARIALASDSPLNLTLNVGETRIAYYLVDCGNNQDSCVFTVKVEDREPPQLSCGPDQDTILGLGACNLVMPLQLPQSISDNCGFAVDNAQPSYFITGATSVALTPLLAGTAPTQTFNQGESVVAFVISDRNGNRDTCRYRVTVRDTEAPVARCQPTTIFVNPSGLEPTNIRANEIDAGSSDNCSITNYTLSPASLACSQAGTVQNITLTVTDRAGNLARCSTIVRVETLEPEPTANSGLCGSDTLFLAANPPAAIGGTVFTFRWTGPNGFASNRQNPFIPNVGSRNAGSYSVEITGITGCKATGVVQVAIEDLPLTPTLLSKEIYCAEEDIVLSSSIVPTGPNVIYRWYRGVAPNGVLVQETIVPTLSIPGPHNESSDNYYLTIETKGCVSPPSGPKLIRVFRRPTAVPRASVITVCENENITLGTETTGPGITYQWTGPNGYNSTAQFPPAITQAKSVNAGVYSLVVSRFGCASDPALITVNILPSPVRPVISYSGAVCEGGNITLRTNATAALYTWLSPDLRPFPTTVPTLDLPNVTAAIEGPWRLQLTTQGCSSELSAPLEVVVNKLPRPVASASPQNVCEGATLELQVTPNLANASYQWSGPSNFAAVGAVVTQANMRQGNAGRYSVRVTTAQGCAGTAEVEVDVRRGVAILNVANDAPRCLSGPTTVRITPTVFPPDDGSLRYQWSGPMNYSATTGVAVIPNATQANAGNYRLVVTNREGCISETSTLLAVVDPPNTPAVPAIAESTPIPFCAGKPITVCTDAYQGQTVTYNWITPNGIVPTSTPCFTIPEAALDNSGVYSVFVSIDGCNSRESGEVTLTVNPKPVIQASSNSPVCSGLAIQLQATNIPGASYSWNGPSFTSTLANPSIPSADSAQYAGSYGVFAELNGCRSEVVTTRVDILPTPRQPVLTANTPLCISSPGALLRLTLRPGSITTGATYTWRGPSGQNLGSGVAPFFDVTSFNGFGEGSFNFTAVAQLGTCTSLASTAFPVVMNAIPSNRAFAGQDFSGCEAQEIRLNAAEPQAGTGKWSEVGASGNPSIGITNPERPNSLVTGLRGGENYRFAWTLSNGACANYSSDTVLVSVNRQDTAFAGSDISACTVDGILLRAKPARNGEGNWTQSDVQALLGIVINEPNNPNSSISGLQPGNLYSFSWNVRGGCGQAVDEVLVLVADTDPFAGPDRTVCNSDALVQLQAAQPAGGSRGRWRALQPTVTFNNPEDPRALARNLSPGPNTFVWELDGGICNQDSRDTLVINYKINPSAVADAIDVPFGQEVQFNVLLNDQVPPGSTVTILQQPFQGSLAALENGIFKYRPRFNFVGEDRFRYQICSEACDCAQNEVVFTIGNQAGCIVPNIITPNNDGINDTFLVPCLLKEGEYPNSQVIIFNSWGDEVFRSPRPYKSDWAGTYNGQDLPAGTYFYILDYGDGSKPRNGFLVIQR